MVFPSERPLPTYKVAMVRTRYDVAHHSYDFNLNKLHDLCSFVCKIIMYKHTFNFV